MKIVELSAFATYSVGTIMKNLKTELQNNGDECFVFYGRGKKLQGDTARFNTPLAVKINALLARFLDNDGRCDVFATKNLVKTLKQIKPDLIHIHCLHGYYVNFKPLFGYFKESGVKVVWTMHDTWAFSGHCCYFESVKCNKWQTGCFQCPAKKEYPKSILIDASRKNYEIKKRYFTSLNAENVTVVSPSAWLDGCVGQSFLNQYPHRVIYNGINTQAFTAGEAQKEKILLAVASVWDRRKNLPRVLRIAEGLREWKVIVVGKADKKLVKQYQDKVQFIPRTTNVDELISLYRRAAVFINPTLDDNLPTVNIEAQLCGCVALTNDVGGAKETDCGNLVTFDDEDNITDAYLDQLASQVKNAVDTHQFNAKTMASEYRALFAKMLQG